MMRLARMRTRGFIVTRLFADFKKKQLLQVKGSTLLIKDKAGLESVLNS